MMGASHAVSGLVAGVATLPWAPVSRPVEQAAWVAAWGGFALIPDMDHANGTAARLWGPVTAGPAAAVGAVAGGHREGTHDVGVAPVVVAVLTGLAMLHPVSTGLVFALAIGLALAALDPVLPGDQKNSVVNFVLAVAGAVLLVRAGVHAPWLPVAAAGGVVVHALGDLPTQDGVPVPLSTLRRGGRRRRLALRLFRTGYRHPVKVGSEVVGYRMGVEVIVAAVLWVTLIVLLWRHAAVVAPSMPGGVSFDSWQDFVSGFGGQGGQPGFAPK